MQYYTYKITFKDLPCYFYYGKHKDNGKPYYGSPTTWMRLWKIFEPEVQILQWYETTEEAYTAEESIIRATWRDKYSLNEHYGGKFSEEVCSGNGKATGKASMAKMPKETLVANGKATGKANIAKMPREVLVAGGKATGSANGKATMTPDRAREFGKATGLANGPANLAKIPRETLIANGKATMTPDRAREFGKANGKANAKTTNSQRWQCLVTGFVSNPGNLSIYQKSRGIDTKLRIRLQG